MHLLGADLHLNGNAVGTEQRGVQRLITVDPRYGDVILEAPRHGFVDAMHQSQRAVAQVCAVDYDANTVDVDHFVQGDFLVLHLLVDAVQMLFAAGDLARDPGLFRCGFERLGDLAEKFFLIAARPLQFALENLVAVRVERPESQILELELDRIKTQALGDRCIDLQRFTRTAAALHGRHDAESAHVVHAVRELDHDDADVAHHRQEHFAEAFGLRLLAVLELNLVEFADAVDEFGDHLAEYRGYFRLGGRRVFDDVVQYRGNQRIGIQAQIGENVGHRDRVRDVRLARDPFLSAVLFGAEFIGFAHPLDLRGRQIRFELV